MVNYFFSNSACKDTTKKWSMQVFLCKNKNTGTYFLFFGPIIFFCGVAKWRKMRVALVRLRSRNNLAIIRQLVRSNLEQKKEKNAFL